MRTFDEVLERIKAISTKMSAIPYNERGSPVAIEEVSRDVDSLFSDFIPVGFDLTRISRDEHQRLSDRGMVILNAPIGDDGKRIDAFRAVWDEASETDQFVIVLTMTMRDFDIRFDRDIVPSFERAIALGFDKLVVPPESWAMLTAPEDRWPETLEPNS